MTTIALTLDAAIPRIASILLLPAIWQRRARFRQQLRVDVENAPDFLRDIGIDVPEAQAEAMRFFWEPVKLQRKTRRRDGLGLYRGIRARRRRKPRPSVAALRGTASPPAKSIITSQVSPPIAGPLGATDAAPESDPPRRERVSHTLAV